jgi:hypothetical protein
VGAEDDAGLAADPHLTPLYAAFILVVKKNKKVIGTQ